MKANVFFSANGITIPMLNRQVRVRNKSGLFDFLQGQKDNLRRFYGRGTSIKVEATGETPDEVILITYLNL